MQGERRTIWSFPEVFDIRQGSTSRTAEQSSLNDILNPADSQYSDFMTSCLRRDPMQGSSSSHMTHNMNLNMGYIGNGDNYEQSTNSEDHFDARKSPGMDMEQASSTFTSFDHVEPSSGNAGFVMDEDSNGSSSFGSLGSSSKRKALEGTSGHSFLGGSSCTLLDTENSVRNNNNFPHYPRVSTPNFPFFDPPIFPYPRTGIGMRGSGVSSDAIPSTRVTRWTDSCSRNFGRMVIWNDNVPPTLSSSGTSGNSNFGPPHHISRSVPSTDSLELRLTAGATANSGSVQNQASFTNATILGPSQCNGSNPMVGSSSTLVIPDERAVCQESNLRISCRNNSERFTFVPAVEMRNSGNDPAAWNVAAGNLSNSQSISSTVRVEPNSYFNLFPAPSFIPPHNGPSNNQQRLSDLTPWSLFPYGSNSGVDSDHFSTFSASSASSRDSILPGRASDQSHRQPYPRPSFLVERHLNNFPIGTQSLRGFVSDIEGRRRLISEDYMLFDPSIYHDMAEMHDRHRDMRLDVDNMSYEELLALEERIGDVSTGLSEDAITKAMKQRKYGSLSTLTSPDVEPCCICREEYADGEDIGSLDCRHDFHTDCIKQWLMQKNLCPICKTIALSSG